MTADTTVHVRVEAHPRPEDVERIRVGLRQFNVERLGDPHYEELVVLARGPSGEVVGGLIGEMRWNALYVEKLWVHTDHRGRGIGRRLLGAAEECAREQGRSHVSLDTFEFQARPFYERLGYRLFGTLEGYPTGYRQFYLFKRLDGDTASAPGASREGEGGRIGRAIERAMSGPVWHGDALEVLLAGVSAPQAAARPIPGAHSIGEIVRHLTAWTHIAAARARGEVVAPTDEMDWPPAPVDSDEKWEDARRLLGEGHAALASLAASLGTEPLDRPLPDGRTTIREMLQGVVEHAAYHGGQIALLRRALVAQ
ncbi:MAG: GNAT family N-acetyltransferase [Gemmatimonadota bacterium]|nr:GNAT family N-acetyltransferase [Gemmatimonadota bacterium]